MADVDAPVAVFKKRGAKAKSNLRKRPATPPPASDDDSEYASSADEQTGTRRVKRARKNGVDVGSSMQARPGDAAALKATEFTADTSTRITDSNDATATSHWFDDNKDLSAKNLLGNTKAVDPADANDGNYRGQAAYSTYLQKKPDAVERKAGPQKASANVRTITITDFAPDVCKDYKQTGFCGFGDSCKFLHMREDYKQGWQLDRDWETAGDKKKGGAGRGATSGDTPEDADAKMLENIPFACVICKKPYTHPVVTKCGHYFCEKCALDRYRKSPSCAACGEGTAGVFNVAKNLKKLLERKKERERRKKELARENGEEVSDDAEDDT